MKTPHPYQRQAADVLAARLAEPGRSGRGGPRPVLVLPTGGGKTFTFSLVISEWRQKNPGKRVLIGAHRTELVGQAVSAIDEAMGIGTAGICQASKDDVDNPVVVGSIPTLAVHNRRKAIKNVGLFVVDECHHATSPSWIRTIDHFDVPTLGVTATPNRSDRIGLHNVFDGPDPAFEVPITRLIRDGYLVNPRGIRVEVPSLNLRDVRRTAGDYQEGALAAALTESFAPELVAEKYREVCRDRSGILFAPTVESAAEFASALRDVGISAATVSGTTPKDVRRRLLADFAHGRVQVICNCAVLTEGFDAPRAEVCVIARPTRSDSLFKQMVGRVLRTFPGKTEALVLDVVSATRTLGLQGLSSLLGRDLPSEETQDDVSLLDIEDELDVDAMPGWGDDGDGLSDYRGPVEVKEVDLLGASAYRWLRSRGGNIFLVAGEFFVVAFDRGDGYGVMLVRRNKVFGREDGRWIAERVRTLEDALDVGEDTTKRIPGAALARESAAARRAPASPGLMIQARKVGVGMPSGLEAPRTGEMLDAMAVVEASARFDAVISAWLEANL